MDINLQCVLRRGFYDACVFAPARSVNRRRIVLCFHWRCARAAHPARPLIGSREWDSAHDWTLIELPRVFFFFYVWVLWSTYVQSLPNFAKLFYELRRHREIARFARILAWFLWYEMHCVSQIEPQFLGRAVRRENQFDIPGMNHCRPGNVRVLVLAWPSGPPTLFRWFSLVDVAGEIAILRETRLSIAVSIRRWRLMNLIRRSIVRMWLFVDHFRSPCLSSLPFSLSPRSRIISLGSLSLAIDRCCRFSFSVSFYSTVDYICLSFSLARGLSWTGSCNECLCRQTHSLASHHGQRWRYFGNITAGYPGC